MTSQLASSKQTMARLSAPERQALRTAIEGITEVETRLTERFYHVFFERRPETRSLFGAHSLAEQEEMMRETIRSLDAWLEEEPWLDANLAALGASHWEYGVTGDMYRSFAEVMITCVDEVLPDRLDVIQKRAFAGALEAVTSKMRDAGDQAASEMQTPSIEPETA